jgi:hypothetical protein
MTEEEKFSCPSCGALVSKGDVYCRKCGVNLTDFSQTTPEAPPTPPELATKEPYERKFSLPKRFYKILTAPSEAMQDITLAPDYGGIVIITVIDFVILVIGVSLALQKLPFSGPNATRISGMLSALMIGVIFFAIIFFVVKWAVKSLIVQYACNSGSGWDFKTAASMTGYAYVADMIMGIFGLFVLWLLVPSFPPIDTTNLATVTEALNNYQAQITWLKLVYTLPLSLLGLVWKSYLGGLGAYFGTKENCSFGKSVAVFFVLGLLSVLVSLLTTFA